MASLTGGGIMTKTRTKNTALVDPTGEKTAEIKLREAVGRELVSPEDVYAPLNAIVQSNPHLRPLVEQAWGAINQLHEQQTKALALVATFETLVQDARNQRDIAIKDRALGLVEAWEGGKEYATAQTLNESVDMITEIIDRDRDEVFKALDILFNGGWVDVQTVSILDDLVSHIAHDMDYGNYADKETDDE
jgi:hypothetical protein